MKFRELLYPIPFSPILACPFGIQTAFRPCPSAIELTDCTKHMLVAVLPSDSPIKKTSSAMGIERVTQGPLSTLLASPFRTYPELARIPTCPFRRLKQIAWRCPHLYFLSAFGLRKCSCTKRKAPPHLDCCFCRAPSSIGRDEKHKMTCLIDMFLTAVT